METIWKGKQTNKQTSRGGTCRGMDAGGGAELHNMQSLIHDVSEYVEELQRCIRDALEKHGVQYAGTYSDKQEAFNSLKKAITSAPILTFPSQSSHFCLE